MINLRRCLRRNFTSRLSGLKLSARPRLTLRLSKPWRRLRDRETIPRDFRFANEVDTARLSQPSHRRRNFPDKAETVRLFRSKWTRAITMPNCALDRRIILCLYVPGFQKLIFKYVPKCKWITKILWNPRTFECNVNFVGPFVVWRFP